MEVTDHSCLSLQIESILLCLKMPILMKIPSSRIQSGFTLAVDIRAIATTNDLFCFNKRPSSEGLFLSYGKYVTQIFPVFCKKQNKMMYKSITYGTPALLMTPVYTGTDF